MKTRRKKSKKNQFWAQLVIGVIQNLISVPLQSHEGAMMHWIIQVVEFLKMPLANGICFVGLLFIYDKFREE